MSHLLRVDGYAIANEIRTEESLRLVNMTGFFEDKMIIPQCSFRLPQTKERRSAEEN
jgi:hypothetical protein